MSDTAGPTLEETINTASQQIPDRRDPSPSDGAPAGAPSPSIQGAADAVMTIAETATMLTVKAFAGSKGIPASEIESMSRLTESEKSQLRLYAPMAAPYFARLVEHSDKIGAFMFGVTWGICMLQRVSELKRKARNVKPPGQPAEYQAGEPGSILLS